MTTMISSGLGIEYDHTLCVDLLTNKNVCANIRVMNLRSWSNKLEFIPYSLVPDYGFESEGGTDHYGAEQ